MKTNVEFVNQEFTKKEVIIVNHVHIKKVYIISCNYI